MDAEQLRALQTPIKDRYREDPNAAVVTMPFFQLTFRRNSGRKLMEKSSPIKPLVESFQAVDFFPLMLVLALAELEIRLNNGNRSKPLHVIVHSGKGTPPPSRSNCR